MTRRPLSIKMTRIFQDTVHPLVTQSRNLARTPFLRYILMKLVLSGTVHYLHYHVPIRCRGPLPWLIVFLRTIFSPPLPVIFVYWFLMRQVDTIMQYMPDFVPSSINVIHYQIIDFLDSLTERCLTVYDCIVAHCFANASEN